MDITSRAIEVALIVVLGLNGIFSAVAHATKNKTDDAIAAWWLKWPVRMVQWFFPDRKPPSLTE